MPEEAPMPSPTSDPDQTYAQWQAQAVAEIFREPDIDARFAVLQRTAETASDAFRLCELPPDDPVGVRLQALPRSHVDRREELEMGEMPVAPEDSRKVHAPIPPDREAEALDAWRFELLLPKNGRLDSMNMALLTMEVEDKLFPQELKGLPQKEGQETMTVPSNLFALARILHEHFGDEVIDLVLALMAYCSLDDRNPNDRIWQLREVMMSAAPEQKRQLLARFFAQYPDAMDPRLKEAALRWALTNGLFDALKVDCPDEAAMLDKVKELFLTKGVVREKLLRGLRKIVTTPDRHLAGVCTRQGWVTLMYGAKEVTDHEWFGLLKKQQEAAKANPAILGEIADSEAVKKRMAEAERDIAEFFAANPNPPPAQDVKRLITLIDCDGLRKEALKLKREHNGYGYAALQQEIACKVIRFVSRYQRFGENEETRSGRDFEQGFPVTVVKEKAASCFSGPWLIAMLLLRAGIQISDLFYCNVQKSHNGIVGGHGAVMMKTVMGEMLMIDHGMSLPGTNASAIPTRNKRQRSDLKRLINGDASAVAILDMPQKFAHDLRMPANMQLMPLNVGFASGHMLHVGNSFLAQRRLDEAQYAFELGLGFAANDPDLLYGLAQVSMLGGNLAEAKKHYLSAVTAFEGHLWSHYGLARIAMSEGDTVKAREHLARVGKGEGEILYGGRNLQKEALRLSTLSDDELSEQWQLNLT